MLVLKRRRVEKMARAAEDRQTPSSEFRLIAQGGRTVALGRLRRLRAGTGRLQLGLNGSSRVNQFQLLLYANLLADGHGFRASEIP